MKLEFGVHLVSSLVIAFSLLVMLGWVANIDMLTSPIPNGPTMKFATAFSIFLGGLLLRASYRQFAGIKRESSQIRAMIISLLFIIMLIPFLASYLFGVSIGFDSVFAPAEINGMLDPSPLPSIGTVVGILALFGISLCLSFGLDSKKYIGWGGIMLAFLGTMALIGYVFNEPELYFLISQTSTGMAIHTAIFMLLLGLCFLYISWKADQIGKDERGPVVENLA